MGGMSGNVGSLGSLPGIEAILNGKGANLIPSFLAPLAPLLLVCIKPPFARFEQRLSMYYNPCFAPLG